MIRELLNPEGVNGAPDVVDGEERDHAQRRLAHLKPDERSGLGLQAAGFSYKEIAARRGWTYTKTNRCITEGRAALRELAVG